MYGSIIQPDKDSYEICIIRSKNSDVLAGFQIYNTKTNKWRNSEKALKSLYGQSKQKETVINPVSLNAYLINPSLNHDDAPQMKLYCFGGKYKTKDNSIEYNTYMYVYDIKTDTWKVGRFSYPTTVDGAVIYLKLYIRNFCGITSDGKYQNENNYNIWLTEDANSISSFTSGNKFPPVSKFSTVYGENN